MSPTFGVIHRLCGRTCYRDKSLGGEGAKMPTTWSQWVLTTSTVFPDLDVGCSTLGSGGCLRWTLFLELIGWEAEGSVCPLYVEGLSLEPWPGQTDLRRKEMSATLALAP